jgi:hypothetical protein
MPQLANPLLRASGTILLAGAAAHLLVIAGGAEWYAQLGAPAGLIEMASAGHPRAAATCVAIALLLGVLAAYAFSAAGAIGRLPLIRAVLAVAGAGLVVRGAAFVPLIFWRPELLAGLCGRCQGVDWFVIATSALCLFLGACLLAGAKAQGPQVGSSPT